jgi:hypothetical protein
MKTAISKLAALLCLFVFLSAFSANKNLPNSIDKPKEAQICYVKFNDGTIKQFATLELVTGVFKVPHLLADGITVINADEIKAYQDKDHYAISQKEFTTLKPCKVAVDVLPGFASRIAAGSLNVYSLKFYNGHNAAEKLFVQAGDSGTIIACTPELLKEMIKGNNDAFTYLNSSDKSTKGIKKMLAAVEIYNNAALITKN